jgi:PAS domain S-box-containing protein
LLHELQNSLAELPVECQEQLTAELDRFSACFEDCFASDLRKGEERQTAVARNHNTPTWLEQSLREVRAGTWRWNGLTDQLEWSAEMYKLYGLIPDGSLITNERFTEMLHPDDRIRVNQKLQDCLVSGATYIDEFRVVTPGGDVTWVNSVASIEKDASGKPLRVLGINQDITARKLAEQALRESQAREHAKASQLAAILEAVPALIWVAEDPECRKVTTSSRYGYEFLGLKKGDNLSKTAPLPEGQTQPWRNFKDGQEIPDDELPMQKSARLGIEIRDYEFEMVFADGSAKHLLGNVVPLFDEAGHPAGTIAAFVDITDRKRMEDELRQSAARGRQRAVELEAILDAVPALVWVTRDPECRYMIGSRHGYEFLKMEKGANLSASCPEEDQGRLTYRNFKDGREIPPDEMPMQVAARTGREFRNFEYDVQFRGGGTRHLLGNVVPLPDEDGTPMGAIAAFTDITERKRMEDELRKNERGERQRAAELQAIIDAVPNPIFLAHDREGYEVTGNLAAYKAMRAEPGSNLSRLRSGVLKRPIRQSLHEGKPLTASETALHRALRSGETIADYEWRLEFEDGSHSVFWGNATPLKDENGQVTGAVSAFIDISTRAAVEEELRRTTRRTEFRLKLRDALRPLTDPDEIKRAAAEVLGRELGASRAFYAPVVNAGEEVILEPGYADGVPMLTGRFRFADFSRNLAVDHVQGQPYMICDVLNDPKLSEAQRSAYLGVQIQSHLDVPLIKDGQIVALLSVEQSTARKWTEDEISTVVETADRTWANVERAWAEAALRASEDRFHAAIESMMESLATFSAVRETRADGSTGGILDLRYDYVNGAACKLLMKSRDEIIGHTLLEIAPPIQGADLLRRYREVIETGESLVERMAFGDSDETRQIFDVRAVRLGDGAVVTRVDVTEQVRVESERQYALTQMEIHHRLAEQSEKERQMYARELHDGPIQVLASIAYNLQYVKEVFPDPALYKELEQIGASLRTAIQDLRQVINELRPPVAIQLGLAKAIQGHGADIQNRSPHICWEYKLAEDGNLLPVPTCLALFRIYQEAVNNIVRHSEATRAWIDFRLETNQAVLEIRDNGKGLPEIHDLDTLTRNHHFGMAGMSERAEEIGSRLVVESEASGGTRIRVAVPLKKEAARSKNPTVPRRRTRP